MERTVKARLELAVAGYQAALARASVSTKQFGKEVAQTSRMSKQEMQTIGTAAAVMGGAITATLALAGRSAIQFESSFAGVRKTVNASEPEFARLAEGMRDMSRSIPTNVNELNAIGEAAGQLGIETGNLLGFTRTMADLGETTNLSADQAATSLARLANITQMPQTEFDRLGSTIVALGNNFATTESEITEMGLRLAGAGSQIGMTEAEILGMATALTSVGINAEAGGSALSKVMIEIASQVETGGDKLSTFASVSGQTVDQFASQWEEDAAGALVAFITGLADTEEQGGSTLQVLEDLEITEVRMRDALLRASGAGDLLNRSMETGTQAYEDNNALAEEAAQRYETVSARIDIARNSFNDAGITIGQTFTPAVGGAADAAAGLFGVIADLPGPVAAGVTAVGGLAGAASLAAGGFLLAAPRIVETKDALQKLSTTAPKTVDALGRVGSLLTGPWGIALAGAITAVGVFAFEQGEAARLAQSLTATLDDQTGALTDVSDAWMRDELDKRNATEAAETLGLSIGQVTDALMGNEDARREVNAAIKEGLHGMGPEEEAAKTLSARYNDLSAAIDTGTEARRRELENAAQAKGMYVDLAHAMESGVSAYEAYRRGLLGTREAADGTGSTLDGLAGGFEGAGEAAAEAVDPVEEFAGAVRTAIGLLLGVADADIAWEQALDDVVETIKESTKVLDENGDVVGEQAASLDRSTQAGRDNERAIIGAVEAAARHGEALMEEGGSAEDAAGAIAGHIAQLRQELIDAGLAEDAVDDLLESYGATPEEIFTRIIADTAEAEAALDRLAAKKAALTGTGYVRVGTEAVVPHGVTRHAGGSGPYGPAHSGKLRHDEFPAVLQHGEFVVRQGQASKHRALLEAINSGALSGVPIFHGGGAAGISSGSFASSAAGNGTGSLSSSVAQLKQAIDDLARTEERRQTDRRRADLWSGIHDARADVASAETAEDRARAEERLADAIRATQEFDRQRRIESEEARLEAQLRIATNREEFEFEQMSSRAQIQMLSAQMAAEKKFTDSYMAMHSKRQQLIQEEIAAARDRAESAMDDLNRMLDEREKVLDQIERAERDHRAEVRSIQQGLSDDIARMVDDRRRQLTSDLPLAGGFGYDAGTISDVLGEETGRLREWASSLDQLRSRGVDDRVVELLGLDRGPEAIHQVTELLRATDGELAELNRRALERERAVGRQVKDERADQTTELGRSIAEATREHDRQIAALQREFVAEQKRLTRELNQIGRDQGRSFNESIAEGMAAGLPAIRRQVNEVLKLYRLLGATSGQTVGLDGGPNRHMSGGGGSTVTIGDLRVEAPPSGMLADYEEAARRVVAGALQGVVDQDLAGAN